MKIAVIGTRNPSPQQVLNASMVTAHLVRRGCKIATGGAVGIDFTAMSFAPAGQLEVFLPWPNYNRELIPSHAKLTVYDLRKKSWSNSVMALHPAWERLSAGSFALHARNYGIIEGSRLVVALPSTAGGGTLQGIRIADHLGIPVVEHNKTATIEAETLIARVDEILGRSNAN